MEYVNSALLQPHKVTEVIDADEGFPVFIARLECGHICMCIERPGPVLYCGDCVHEALSQIRGMQKEPIRREES